MTFDAFKHVYVWSPLRKPVGLFGVWLLMLSRRILTWSKYRCSWCGRDPGMNSVISRKGLRCSGLYTRCDLEP